MKQIAGRVKLELAQYREVAAFAQFGSDLDQSTLDQLNRGSRLQELLKQAQYSPLAMEDQIVIIFAGVRGFLDKIELSQIKAFEAGWVKHVKESHPEIIAELKAKSEKMSKEFEQKLSKVCGAYVQQFLAGGA
jgi:F0F1-type ATP synthase alpha subunit